MYICVVICIYVNYHECDCCDCRVIQVCCSVNPNNKSGVVAVTLSFEMGNKS